MSYLSYPPLGGGGGGGPAEVTFPLVAPTPGAAGAEPFAFKTGGGLHGDGSGGVALSSAGYGDGLTLSPQGLVGIPGALTTQGLATLAGGLTTQALAAASAAITGNTSVGGSLGVSGSAQVTGDLSARNITAQAAISGASATLQGALSADSLQVAHAATLGSLNVQGTFQAGQIASDGAYLFPTTSPSSPGVALTDEPSSGLFGAPGTIGIAVRGASALSFGASLAASFAGNLTAQGGTFTSLSTSSLTAGGTVSFQDARVVTLESTGPVALGAALTVATDLTVGGTTRLANLAIDHLSTDHDLTVGGGATVTGALFVFGDTGLGGGLAVAGAASSSSLSTGSVLLAAARQLLTDASYTPVVTVPTSGGSLNYTFDLAANGNLAMSGALRVLRGASVSGALSSGAISAPSLSASGTVSAASLAASGPVSALTAQIGGATLSAYPGNPNGNVTGALGDTVFDRTDGLIYIKAGGSGTNTGWAAVITQASASAYPILLPTAAASAPQLGFADDPMTGFGRTSSIPAFIGVAGAPALSFAASRAGSFAAGLSVAGALQVSGATTLAALSAQSSSLGSTTTSDLTATTGAFSGALSSPSATIGSLGAGTLTVTGNTTFNSQVSVGGQLSVVGALSSQSSIASPYLLVNGARIGAGSGSPNGQVSGSPGDEYHDQAGGALWVKASGTNTTSGWAMVATSAGGTTFPLAAPDGSLASPSYGFAQGPLGITAGGANILWGVSAGKVGWTLDANQNFGVAAALSVAGALSASGATSLQGLTASQATISGNLGVSGSATVGALAAAAATVASLTTTSGGVSSAAAVSAASSVTAGSFLAATTYVASGASQWASSASAPTGSGGTQGDLVTVTSGARALYVRGPSTYQAVALVGDPAPTQFPLLAPLDSASAPSYASARSPDTGMYAPAAKQLGFSTAGTVAATVDASQNWTFAAAVSAGAGTFSSAAVNGTFSATAAATFGSTIQVTGAATFAASLSAASASISGQVSAASGTFSGALGTATLTTSGDATVGGNLTVNGTTTYTGVNRAPLYQVGDGTVSAPSFAFTSQADLGIWKAAANTLGFAAQNANLLTLAPSLATFTGAVRVGATNAGLTSPGTNQLALQTAGNTALSIAANGASSFSFQALFTAGTAAAPGVGIGGASSGLYTGTDANTRPFVGVSSGGLPVARFIQSTANSLPVYFAALGDPTSSTVTGGLAASAQAPSTGAAQAQPGVLYVDTRGGAAQTAWVNESTTATPSFAKLLTTSSTIAVTYPILAPSGSAAAPTYSFSASASSGFTLATDAGSGNIPAPALVSQGKVCAFADFVTQNSTTVYGLVLGDPTINASPYPAAIRASSQSFNGNVIGAVGNIGINPTGGAGSVLTVKESGTGSASGWSNVLTSGTTQIAGQTGTAAAPYHSFSGALGSGLYAIGTVPYIAHAGSIAIGFLSSVSNQPYPAITFGLQNVDGNPYIFGASSSTGNAGNPNTNAITGFRAGLMLNAAGAAGDQMWIHEGTSSTSGWVRVLSENTQLNGLTFKQVSQPTNVSGLTKIWCDTNNLVRLGIFVNSSSAPTLKQEIVATPYGASQAITQANNNTTICLTSGTQFTLTLPANSASLDLCYRFQVETSAGVVVKANTGQTINNGGNVSSSAGTLTTTTAGATIELFCRAGTNVWFARGPAGVWSVA